MHTEENEYYDNKRIIEKENQYEYLNHKNKNIVIIVILIIIFLTGLILFIKSFRKTNKYIPLNNEILEVECSNTIAINQELSIKITVNENINPNINFLSSDNNIIEVSNQGTIKGINLGNASITIVYFDINNVAYTKTINVTVID